MGSTSRAQLMEPQPISAGAAAAAAPSARGIFDHAVVIRSPEPRRAYLAAACGHDDALRRQVDGLLEAYEAAGSFLDARVYDLGTTSTSDEPGPRPLRE